MAEIRAEICKIETVFPHENAHSLEIAQVKGWNCVISKGSFQPGDLCLYVPVDACIPQEMESELFKNAKIKLTNGRIKAIRIRQVVSQGLVVDPKKFGLHKKPEGYDATAELGITKYEPPAPAFQGFNGGGKKQARIENPNFTKYTSIENIKNHWKVFTPDDEVFFTEKLHGTNWRAGWVERVPTTWFEKLWMPYAQKFFPDKFKWEFMVGSHNVQLKESADNLYCNIARKYQVKEKLAKGQSAYGEVIGPGIQKHFDYGLKEPALVLFDVKTNGVYEPFETVQQLGKEWGIEVVPVLAEGKVSDLDFEDLAQGPSVYCPTQQVREGGVIRTKAGDKNCYIGRKILKQINPEYLMLKDNTDYH